MPKPNLLKFRKKWFWRKILRSDREELRKTEHTHVLSSVLLLCLDKRTKSPVRITTETEFSNHIGLQISKL